MKHKLIFIIIALLIMVSLLACKPKVTDSDIQDYGTDMGYDDMPEDFVEKDFRKELGDEEYTLEQKFNIRYKKKKVILPEERIRIIIEFEQEPLLPYRKTAEIESEDSLLTKTLDIFMDKEAAKNYTRDRKIKKQIEKIGDTHKDLLKDLKINKPKREWKSVMNGMAVTIKQKDFDEIKNMPNVKNVWEDEVDQLYIQDSVPLINADDVWLLDADGNNCSVSGEPCLTGEGILVAVIDTGVAYNHSDFEPSCDTTAFLAGNCNKTIYGWNYVYDTGDPYDDYYHGTHCAGIIGANGQLKGVAPNVTFLAYKVCNYYGQCLRSDIVSAIENATNYGGVDIISMSLGGAGYADDNPYVTPIDNAVASGIVVVASAGNSGQYSHIGIPSGVESAISVGSTTKSDEISGFSSKGYVFYSNGSAAGIKPDVLAPGSVINSTVPEREPDGLICYRCDESGYRTSSGTSFSAPTVTGMIALLRQAHPDWSVKEIRSAISNTAIDLGYDVRTQGAGRIDVLRAYNTSTLAIPNLIFLGVNADFLNTSYDRTAILNITNKGNESLDYTFSLNFTTGTEEGINLTINSTSATLLANESTYILINLTINNSNTNLTGYKYGFIKINSSNKQDIRVPFGFRNFIVSIGCPLSTVYVDENMTLDRVNCTIPLEGTEMLFIFNKSGVTLDCNYSEYTGGTSGEGLFVVTIEPEEWEPADNLIIKNCIVDKYAYALRVFSDYNTLESNTFKAVSQPISFPDGSYNTIRGNTFNTGPPYGYLSITGGSSNNNVTNNTFNAQAFYIGYDSADNQISNNIYNCSGRCLTLTNAGSDNSFTDEVFDGEVYITSGSNKDNKFINSTYPTLTFAYKSEDSNILRQWYLTVNITDENSNPLSNANVIVYQNSSSSWVQEWSETTDSSGLSTEPATQYNQNSTDLIYYTLNISATKAGHYSNSTLLTNLDGNMQIDLVLQSGFPDTENPTVTLISPPQTNLTNVTLSCSATDDIDLKNISVYGNWSGDWLFNQSSDISGTSNSSDFNVTNLDNGTYIWNCLAYDTSNNSAFASSNDTFIIDTSYGSTDAPNVTIATPLNNSYSTVQHAVLNFTAVDDFDNLTCWYILDGSTTSISELTTITLQNETTENLDDTFVDAWFSTNSYGGDNHFHIGENVPDYLNWAFSKFSITSLPSTIDSAKLYYYISGNGYDTGETASITVYELDNHIWDELTLTWDNKPAEGNLLYTNDTYDGDDWEVWISFDVTSWVQSELDDGDNNVSFVVKGAVFGEGADRLQVDSKEQSNSTLRPYLLIIQDDIVIISGTSYTINLTSLSEGSHELNVTCQDVLPGQNGTSATYTFYVDLTAPAMSNPVPSDGSYVEGGLSEIFSISVSESVSLDTDSGRFYWSYLGQAFTEETMTCSATLCSFNLDMTALSTGDVLEYYFEVNDTAKHTGNSGTSLNPLSVTKGFLPINAYDGNWDTYMLATNDDEVMYLYINYTKPDNSLNSSLWLVKDENATINLTILTECWDQTILQFRADSDKANDYAYWRCWNSTDWYILRSHADSTPEIYEEAMDWDMEEIAKTECAQNNAYTDSIVMDTTWQAINDSLIVDDTVRIWCRRNYTAVPIIKKPLKWEFNFTLIQ